jgi:hypothetical protein
MSAKQNRGDEKKISRKWNIDESRLLQNKNVWSIKVSGNK